MLVIVEQLQKSSSKIMEHNNVVIYIFREYLSRKGMVFHGHTHI
jgi:hypothetical protein